MESTPKVYDSLGYSNDKKILKIIKSEQILFCDKIIKINRKEVSQERVILITNKGIYNLRKKELKREIKIHIVIGISVSKITDEFVIHCAEAEYDYHYLSKKRREILIVIAYVYKSIKQEDLMICELKENNINKIVTTKKEKSKNPSHSRMPQENKISASEYLKMENSQDITSSQSEQISKTTTIERDDTIYSNHKTAKKVDLNDFEILKVIGRGSFGKVCLVKYKVTGEIFAMKSLKKDILIEQDQIENTILEKEILQKIDHPLLCGLVFCFQTEERIYFIMPFLNGGELFQHLRKIRKFDEERVRFYAAQIALALQYLHDLHIIYRDLKPENILMDDKGYLRLADFGMAKKLKEDEKAMSFCGTPEYLAPEVLTEVGHDKTADWWSFGILIYEMLCGLPPFYVDNIERMYEMIKSSPVKFPKKINLSEDAKDLILKLLEKNPKERLGAKGIKEIQTHPFFATIDFDMVLKKEYPAPFVPTISDSTDVQYFDEEFTNEEVHLSYIPNISMDIINQNQDKFKTFSN